MSLKRLVVVLLVVCLGAVVATVAILRWRSPADDGDNTANGPDVTSSQGTGHAPDGTVYAYSTTRELVVMSGDRVLARQERIFDAADPWRNKVVWTSSGNYVATLSNIVLRQLEPADEELLYINVRTGETGRIPCPGCTDIAPVGSDTLLVKANGKNNEDFYLRYDLSSPGVKTPVDLRLTDNGSTFLRQFMAGAPDYVLTHQGSFLGNSYYQHLELAKTDGSTTRDLGAYLSNDYMPVAATQTSTGEARFAVGFREEPGRCETDFPILLLGSTSDTIHTDMSAAQPPGFIRNVQGGMEVHDLWYGFDGVLYTIISSWTCKKGSGNASSTRVPASPASLFKLDGRTWTRVNDGPATTMRLLEGNASVVLTIPDCLATPPPESEKPGVYCNTGPLTFDSGGGRKTLAEQVIALYSPPPRPA